MVKLFMNELYFTKTEIICESTNTSQKHLTFYLQTYVQMVLKGKNIRPNNLNDTHIVPWTSSIWKEYKLKKLTS